MSLETEVRAIRLSAAMSEETHRICLRVAGKGAAGCLDRICPCDLYIRDGQMQQTLLLNDRGNPIADLSVCADGDDFLLLADGLDANELSDLLKGHCAAGEEIRITDLTGDHVLISVTGPYAWELLSEAISTEIIGLPFSGFFHGEDFTCFRSSSTGEFSYDLLIHKGLAPKWRDRLMKVGKAFDLEIVDAQALDLCALENFVFNIRKDAIGDVSPLELQLQWRISYKKTFPGSEALLERRNRWTHRAVLLYSPQELKAGDRVRAEKQDIGSLLNAGFSFDLNAWVGLALLQREWAYSGVDAESVTAMGVAAPARILSAPVINNRSLFVDPQRHTYAGRAENIFPSLIHALPR